MRWIIRATYYNGCKFIIEQMPFIKDPYETAKDLLFKSIALAFVGLWAWFFAAIFNYLDILFLSLYSGFSILVFYLVSFRPVLGNERWRDVIDDERYDTKKCKIVATITYLAGFIGIGIFLGYIVPWSEMINKYN